MQTYWRELLPPLGASPSDVGSETRFDVADEVIYRLGLQASPVPGLPTAIAVGEVILEFVEGPIRAQQTIVRQRHGLPVQFDKYMVRDEIGPGQLIALLSIRTPLLTRSDIASMLETWRARALAAAGLVASILDERVVGPELFEDALLLARGEYVGALDRHSNVRSYLPLEVNASDAIALTQLDNAVVDESSRTARAARLYRRAAIEGPTADAYAMLWVAAECFSDKRTPSRHDIEATLLEAGLNPAGLPISVGRLIGLRAQVQHHGFEDLKTLGTAFYEMESIVRVLIRREMRSSGGWWPAHNSQAFAEPFDEAVATAMEERDSVWHENGLPPVTEPHPQRIPRRVARPEVDARLKLDPALGDSLGLVSRTVVDALEWSDPEATLSVYVGNPPGGPADCGIVASGQAIWIPPDCLEGLTDSDHPEVLANLVWDVTYAVGAAVAQRAGIESEGDGTVIVGAIAAWTQYLRLCCYGGFDAELLIIPPPNEPIALGKIAGWSGAGDARARRALRDLSGHEGDLCRHIADFLRQRALSQPFDLLS